MYKVFIDNSCVVFKKNEKFSTNVGQKFLPKLKIESFENFKILLNNYSNEDPCFFESPEPLNLLKEFFSEFKWIEAAGGVVKNTKLNKHLFIYRQEKWDLPKGKIEKNESAELAAVREVQEECGIADLAIKGEFSPTYHVYHAYDNYWIKKTHWYDMFTPNFDSEPQLEEGITKVEWLDKNQVIDICPKTYASLIHVIEESILNTSD